MQGLYQMCQVAQVFFDYEVLPFLFIVDLS